MRGGMADGCSEPVFVDTSGRRRWVATVCGTALGIGLVLSLGVVVAGLLGTGPVALPRLPASAPGAPPARTPMAAAEQPAAVPPPGAGDGASGVGGVGGAGGATRPPDPGQAPVGRPVPPAQPQPGVPAHPGPPAPTPDPGPTASPSPTKRIPPGHARPTRTK